MAVDNKQTKLVFSLGISKPSELGSLSSSSVACDATSAATAAPRADSRAGASSSCTYDPTAAVDLYSSLGPSASACVVEQHSPCSSSSDVLGMRKLIMQYETMIRQEVADWLEGVLDRVVASSGGGKHFKRSRMRYTHKRKAAVVNAFSEMHNSGDESMKHTMQRLRSTLQDGSLTAAKVNRWRTNGPVRKAGRKYCEAFERQVLDELVFTSIEKVDNQVKAVIVANVCYSHDLIITAAKKVQARPEWTDEILVNKLKFRRTWIKGWLHRQAMRPRRITAQAKELPSPEIVQARMLEIQQRIVEGDYREDEVYNGDETGMFFGAPPKKQYVPFSADRATAPEGDEKARFTSFLFASSDGVMAPTFNIIKSQSRNAYDLSGTTKLKSLHCDVFTEQDGWRLEMWSRTIMLPNARKELVPTLCKRPYLISSTGDVITCQNKAWMDSAGIAMWCDVQFGPIAKAKRGKALMVWDNCGPHKVEGVRQVFAEWGVEVRELPPKMTDILQVMDLAVNGPLKAAIRRMRSQALFSYFQEWKIARLTASAHPDKPPLPPFRPPKPAVEQGIQTVLQCTTSTLGTPEFGESLRKTFVKVGLRRKSEAEGSSSSSEVSNMFVEYHAHKKAGWLMPTLMGNASPGESKIMSSEVSGDSSDPILSLGEIVTEFAMEPRDESRMNCEGLLEDSEEDDGDGGDA